MSKTKIIEIGSLVSDFKEEKLLVLFDETAPPELRDISIIHQFDEKTQDAFHPGKTLQIGNKEYTIEKVGSEANSNFEELGHVSIYFKEDGNEEILPGAVIVTPSVFPELHVGDFIVIK